MSEKTTITAQQRIDELQARLSEVEHTLDAIRHGSVDALVVKRGTGQEIFTLRSADYAYRVLIESMNQGALTLNFDGTILYSNKRFGTMLGVPLKHIIGTNILKFVIERECKYIEALLRNAGHAEIQQEVTMHNGNNSEITVMISAVAVSQEKNNYLCPVVTDMTDRKRAEDAKDEFISLASHQLRTPATSVKQFVNMLSDGLFGEVNPAQKTALEKINTSNDRELRIVDDLLKVAQIDAGKIIPKQRSTDLRPLLQDVVSDQRLKIKQSGQRIKFTAPPEPVHAFVDEYLIRMVVENLVDNASKYMSELGTITVTIEAKDDSALIHVADQGVGMSETDTAMLYKKFSRIPNSLSVKAGGNGLGLYWVKKVVDLHNGSIAVSSTVGKGTIFTVNLPDKEQNA